MAGLTPWLRMVQLIVTSSPTCAVGGTMMELTTRSEGGGSKTDIGDDLVITGTSRRAVASGTWAHGKVAGHKFEALVFPEHAEQESFELDQSKISKLQIKRIADGAEVCSFDRGWDCEPVDATTRAVVEFLKGILADRVYG